MQDTTHLTHRLNPQEYAWDTVNWAIHSYLPAWLHGAHLAPQATMLEQHPQIWDLDSWSTVAPKVAICASKASEVWQRYLTPRHLKLTGCGADKALGSKWWELCTMPIWSHALELIRRSGWWRIRKGAYTGNTELLPAGIVTEGLSMIWQIPRDLARLSIWQAQEERITEAIRLGRVPSIIRDYSLGPQKLQRKLS